MAKKKESVGVIKPKRVAKKISEVDKELSWIEAMHEIDAVFKIRVNEIKEGMVSREEYDDYVKRATEWRTNINTRISGLEDDRLILKYSFFARIKWLFTGKVDAPKWR